MSSAAEHLRARILAVPTQGSGRRRYGAELKRAVVEHALARQGEGATIRASAEELGLTAGLLYKWLHHGRLEPEKGKVPFEPGESPPMPWRELQEPAAESSGAGSTTTSAEPVKAGSVPFSVRSPNDSLSCDGMPRHHPCRLRKIVREVSGL